MAFVLLGIMFALIVAVFALPHLPFVRKLAGIDTPEQELVMGPVVTDNYRSWMLRPVARTADKFPSSARRGFDLIEPVTILGRGQQVIDLQHLAYPPRGIRIYGPEGSLQTVGRSANKGRSCRVDTSLLPERRATFELGIALGDRNLLGMLSEREYGEQQADILTEG